MCGLAGFLSVSSAAAGNAGQRLAAMTGAISHRGPDDDGQWIDPTAGVALGHRRLSIIDLSPAGHQPMASATGRYTLVYNGEIYNHRAIRRELEEAGAAPHWRGHSDTEVLLAAIEHWGFEQALERTNGMFALALWDAKERLLLLARDRLGEKPLYYGRFGDTFLFASELKALTAHPAFRGEIDRDALALYMRYGYVPAPYSIWQGVAKLPAGHWMAVREGGQTVEAPRAFWDFTAAAEAGARTPRADTPALVDELEGLLGDAVGLRMEADVPLGAFLSGGIDSSLIVALMQQRSSRPVKSFSIGFHEKAFDEAEHARAVAQHLGTDHTELYLTPQALLDEVPGLPHIWDEPFADSSQIPTLLVSRLARQHVTVALSGDGGDELFGGYDRYAAAQRVAEARRRLPQALQPLAAGMLRSGPAGALAAGAARLMPGLGTLPDRLPKLADVLESGGDGPFYRTFVSQWANPAAVVLGGREPATPLSGPLPAFADLRQVMMYADTLTYLPDDILVKTDRAAMAVSLETRVPFLDHRLVEFAWSVPMAAKVRGGVPKAILRDLLYRHVPRALIDRPKMGFSVPIADWLVGPLRPWVEGLLDRRRLAAQGYLDPDLVCRAWEDHKSGRHKRHYQLWTVLMFQAWLEEQGSRQALAA